MSHLLKFAATVISIVACISFLDAKEYTKSTQIDQVTVYMNGAQVKRNTTANIPTGRHTLVFTNLENGIDPNSIQLGGKGNFTLLSVSHRSNYLLDETDDEKLMALKDSLEMLNFDHTLLKHERTALAEERSMLMNNKQQVHAQQHISVQELKARADFYRTHLSSIGKKEAELDREISKLQSTIARIQRQINQFGSKKKHIGEIVAKVAVKATTKASLKLSYTVRQAGWSPLYDLRAENIGENITLQYNAKVWQRTGQPWKNIKLILSTGNPFANKTKPVLTHWRLDFVHDGRQGSYGHSNRKFSMAAEADAAESTELSLSSVPMSKPSSHIQQNATDFQYVIDERYTIDGNGIQEHVIVDEHELKATYEYYAAPKPKQAVFLLANVYDWHKYNLLSGAANLFFENTYVGKTYINGNSTADTLSLSLGQDKRIAVKRERIDDYCKSSVLGGNKKESIGIRITVKNNGPKTVSVSVEDQIPLPANSDIEVKLVEDSGAEVDNKTGFLKWNIVLAPGASKDIVFQYEVKLPKDKRVRL